MVLCAGFGTRLRPLTDELPKPLVWLGDRSLLAHIASGLSRAGFSELVLNIHHLYDEFISKLESFPFKTHVIREVSIRGTAGGVRGAAALLGSPPTVVWNGDVWVEPPLGELLALAERSPIALAVAPRERGQGVLGLGEGGEIVRLRGEVFGFERTGGDYVGVCALGASGIARLPEQGCLIGDVTLPLLREGSKIPTARCRGAWSDIGSIDGYLDANLRWLEESGPGGSFVARGAVVSEGVRLFESVVGEGARVSGQGDVVRSVIWPGASAAAPLSDAVVTGSGRVVRRAV